MICNLFFFLSRLGGDRDFLLIGTVFDAMCFARSVFQRATRRMAHCLFVCVCASWLELLLFSSSRRECFRVSTRVSSERSVTVGGLFHGCGTVGVTLHVGFERGFLEGEICGGDIGGRANAGQRFVSVACLFFFDNARASCPLPIHADVFVLTRFFFVFGLFIRVFVSFVLGTAWVVFTTCRDLSFPSDVSESRTESSLVTCTITSLLFVSPIVL